MVFSFFKRRRRQKILSRPFPASWRRHLEQGVRYYACLSAEEKTKLHGAVSIFVAEKTWEGCGGQEIHDEIKVTVAAHAALLGLGFEDFHFDGVSSILVYPGGYLVKGSAERPQYRMGEADEGGAVVVSWWDGPRRAARVGQVVLHEFAHLLDMITGEPDGTPPFDSPEEREHWQQAFRKEFELHVENETLGRPSVLSSYGAESPGEFFAVATECFFQRPTNLEEERPELYEMLRGFYRQDPAARFREHGLAGGRDDEDEAALENIDHPTLEELDETIRRHPDLADAYRERASLLAEEGESGKAIDDLDEVLRLEPDDVEAHLERGQCRIDAGDLDGAIADFRRALRLAPGTPDAHAGCADAYLARGDYRKALEECDRAIRLDPDHGEAYDIRSVVNEALGRLSEAKRDAARARELGEG